MPPESPQLDQRSYQEIVQQTQVLAKSYTPWQSPAPDSTDVGLALIRIFGRMAGQVQERLNQVPERNRLAFMNLTGTQLTPPQPARVPVTFSLAAGSPMAALVPPHTQIAAPPPEGEETEVVFETERELLVTPTQLESLFVIEDRDYYSDRNTHVPADTEHRPFEVLRGDRPVEHYLFLHGAAVFDLPKLTTVSFTITADSSESATQLVSRFLTWEAWDGKQWQPLISVALQTEAQQVYVTLDQLPKLKAVEVNGLEAKWLRVTLYPHRRESLPEILQIQVSASVDQRQIPQECFFDNIALDLSKDFYPFGSDPAYNSTFRLALDPRLLQPGVAIEINTTLSHVPSHTADLVLEWEVGNGHDWQAIEIADDPQKFCWLRNSTPPKFTEASLQGTFRFPTTFVPVVTEADAPTYWLRARIIQGRYGNRGRTRNYVMYNDITMLSEGIAVGQTEIVVDSVDDLAIEDTIRLQAVLNPSQQEDVKIIEISTTDYRITLNRATRNAYAIGSRVLGKFTIADPTPNQVDPPLVKAMALTYKFFLEQPATALAYNDFAYIDGCPLSTVLAKPASAGVRVIHLKDVRHLTLGEHLRFPDTPTPNRAHTRAYNLGELRQIELIDPEHNLVILTEALSQNYSLGTPVVRAFYPLTPQLYRDSALYLGFNQAFPNRPSTVYLEVQPPEPEEIAPGTHRSPGDTSRLVWEYPSPEGWHPLTVQDETTALTEKGLVQFIGPTDWIASPHFGQQYYWLRIRQQPNAWEDIPLVLFYLFKWAVNFQRFRLYGLMRYLSFKVRCSADMTVPPRLRNARTNTTWAQQSVTLNEEILGSSNYDPNQIVTTSQIPILEGQQLEIEEGRMPSEAEQQHLRQQLGPGAISTVEDETGQPEAVWVRWQEVPDFYSSTASDRHYTLDRQQGHIQFGDGQAGLIPPRGNNNIRLTYRTGGGQRGNQTAQTLVELKTTIPYVADVINWEAAEGGNDQESLERLKDRSPKRLRHRNRAVTAEDFADLAYDAAVEVARVQVITPEMLVPGFNPLLEELWVEPNDTPTTSTIPGNEIDLFDQERIRAGRVQLIIVPQNTTPQPTPTLALLNRVEQFLQARFVATLRLQVSGPKWLAIGVSAEIVPVTVTNAGTVKALVEEMLQRFLHPLTGGRQGKGWDFGHLPHPSDLYAALEAVPGVSYVSALAIQPTEANIDRQTLIYSGVHQITLKLSEANA